MEYEMNNLKVKQANARQDKESKEKEIVLLKKGLDIIYLFIVYKFQDRRLNKKYRRGQKVKR